MDKPTPSNPSPSISEKPLFPTSPELRPLAADEILIKGDYWGWLDSKNPLGRVNGLSGITVAEHVKDCPAFIAFRRIEAVEAKPEPSNPSPKALEGATLTHTPTPWTCDGAILSNGKPFWDVRVGDGSVYGTSLAMLCNRDNVQQDAEFIVKAVNEHDSLVARLSSMGEMERVLEAAQAQLGRYIVPGSGLTEKRLIDNLLAILDDRKLVEAMRAIKGGK